MDLDCVVRGGTVVFPERGEVPADIAIRDGRTSMEIFRKVEQSGGVTRIVHDEYVLVDSAGRLQVPREFLDRLSITDRAKLLLGEGRIEVLPDTIRRVPVEER